MADAENTLRTLVAQVAAAYFSNSHVPISEIGTVVDKIAASLGGVGATAAAAPLAVETAETPMAETPSSGNDPDEATSEGPAKPTPAQIRRSITPDALVSFEDGRPYKTLRRHLTARGLTPEQYRDKWSLPDDYPMVSPNYSAARSKMAKSVGLGQRAQQRRAADASAAPARQARGRVRADD